MSSLWKMRREQGLAHVRDPTTAGEEKLQRQKCVEFSPTLKGTPNESARCPDSVDSVRICPFEGWCGCSINLYLGFL